MKIKIFTVGGTIDKVYFDSKSTYQVGDPTVLEILKEANVHFDYACETILRKDSLDMTDEDRQRVFDTIQTDEHDRILVTHGTDTLVETAKKLTELSQKVVVLTGSIQPARWKMSDAPFNVGAAIVALQLLDYGVYIVMNGRVFDPTEAQKNVVLNRFEEIPPS